MCAARSAGWLAYGGQLQRIAGAAEAVVDEIQTKGGEALALPGDVAVKAEVLALLNAAGAAFGPIGGTINTAGFLDPARPLAEIGHARWQRIFAITPTGSFLAAREAVRRMLRAGHGGVIVNMWSMAAQVWGS